jgi:hypothetical protein
MKLHTQKCIIFFTIFQFFLVSGLLPAARAALVPTQAFIESTQPDTTRSQIQTMLAREDVQMELQRLGVNPEMAKQRLAALSPAELQQLQRHMNDMPAGAGALEVIGIVFLILLILELVGVTNVFSKF